MEARKGVIRSCKSKDRQHNSQKIFLFNKNTNNGQQNTSLETNTVKPV